MPLARACGAAVVKFRNDLIKAGVGPRSIVKTMSMLQRVFRDAVELGEARSTRSRR